MTESVSTSTSSSSSSTADSQQSKNAIEHMRFHIAKVKAAAAAVREASSVLSLTDSEIYDLELDAGLLTASP